MDLAGLITQFQAVNYHHYYPADTSILVNPSKTNSSVIFWGYPKLDLSLLTKYLELNYQILILATTRFDLNDPDQLTFLTHPLVSIVCSQLKQYTQLLPQKSLTTTPSTIFFDFSQLPYVNKKVILLMRDAQRVSHVQQKLLTPLSNITVFPATDAQTPGALDTFLDREGLQVTTAMKAGMVGCFCSHYRIWQALLKSEDPLWLILEDDVVLADDDATLFSQNLKALLNELPSSFDLVYVYLSPQYHRDDSEVHLSPPKRTLNQAYENTNSSAYLISRKGAQKLLDYCRQNHLSEPIDEILSRIAQQKNFFEAYATKQLLFDNIGLKATQLKQGLKEVKLESNIDNSRVYRPSTPILAHSTGFLGSLFRSK